MTEQLSMFAQPTPHSFDRDAMGYLLRFARNSGGQPFSAEQVTQSAIEAGIAPIEPRAWGSVFQQAAKDGAIRRSDVLFSRALGNGSLSPGWASV